MIKAGGLSSAVSAAIGTVRSLTSDTPADWHSVAVCSDGIYGVEKNLISFFPIHTKADSWAIAQNVSINEFSRGKIDAWLRS